MDKNIIISVIIPCYNGEKYLAQCIENILCQTYKHLEIIVIDDGSTDKSAEIAEKYSVKLIRQSNKGLAAARNTGIAYVSGDYVHFFDVDDLISLNFYEKMLNSALATDSDIACCGFIHERYPSKTQHFNHSNVVSVIDDKLAMTNVGIYGACWRYLFKTAFLKKHNLLFEEGRLVEDKAFSLQAVYFANKIVSVPQAVYTYKNRGSSIMTTKNIKRTKKRHQDRRYAVEFCKKFAEIHNFLGIQTTVNHKIKYKFFGIPFLTKRIYNNGKTRFYLFNFIYFLQKKDS